MSFCDRCGAPIRGGRSAIAAESGRPIGTLARAVLCPDCAESLARWLKAPALERREHEAAAVAGRAR